MKRIKLYRPKESFNKNCSYKIFIGKTIFAELGNGEERTIEITDELENQELIAKVQWCGSEKFALKSVKENEKITVSGNKFLNKNLPVLGAIFPLTGIVIFNTEYLVLKYIGIGILVIFLLGLIGTLTVGKDKWLTLKN